MGKKWDYDVPSVELWKEVYRVLKPGGHVLSFGGTRTYHRMVVNLEDAGFEIRDQIMWIHGSGFPKSHNIGKAVDKLQGNKREVVGERSGAMNNSEASEAASFVKDGVGFKTHFTETKGNSPHEGWGTALKPANEPICVARKPLSEKSVAENVLKWGTGGLNIDGCRIGTDTIKSMGTEGKQKFRVGDNNKVIELGEHEGRFPSNLILDEEAARMLDEQSGISKSNCKSGIVEGKQSGVMYHNYDGDTKPASGHKNKIMVGNYNDKGGASRFFYIPKVSKKERNMGLDGFEDKVFNVVNGGHGLEDSPNFAPKLYKNIHPTVKPVQLMTYLCRLVTPPNGIVLDPFMGSGSTGIGACLEGFRFVGMELSEEYFKIAEARIENYEKYREFVEKKKKK